MVGEIFINVNCCFFVNYFIICGKIRNVCKFFWIFCGENCIGGSEMFLKCFNELFFVWVIFVIENDDFFLRYYVC